MLVFAGEAAEEVEDVCGDLGGGVLHEEEGGEAVVLDGEAVELSDGGAGEDVDEGAGVIVALGRWRHEESVPSRPRGGLDGWCRSFSMTTLAIILVGLGIAAFICLAFWTAVLVEVVWMVRKLPTARSGVSGGDAFEAGKPPSVCLIIPAYNEEKSIATVAESLLKQDYPNLSVVFALDRCTDRTEEVLAGVLKGDARFSTFKVTECPADWAGKVNAVWKAVSEAPQAKGAEIIAFADADTYFDPACIRACVNVLKRENYGLLSLMSTLTCEHWFEKVVQPVAGYELMRQYPPRRVNRAGDRSKRRAIANGQFMMFTREAYWSFGGHANEQVKDELLEDIALAKRVRDKDMLAGFIPAAGMLYCKMYDSYGAFEMGWRRIFAELAHRRPRRLRNYAAQLLLTDLLLPLLAALAVVLGVIVVGSSGQVAWWGVEAWAGVAGGVVGLSALVMMQVVMAIGCRWGHTPQYVGLLHLPGAWFVFVILMRAARDLEEARPVRWGGRMYIRPPRYEGDEQWYKRWFLGRRSPHAAD